MSRSPLANPHRWGPAEETYKVRTALYARPLIGYPSGTAGAGPITLICVVVGGKAHSSVAAPNGGCFPYLTRNPFSLSVEAVGVGRGGGGRGRTPGSISPLSLEN